MSGVRLLLTEESEHILCAQLAGDEHVEDAEKTAAMLERQQEAWVEQSQSVAAHSRRASQSFFAEKLTSMEAIILAQMASDEHKDTDDSQMQPGTAVVRR